jgi:hypothetical protein
MGASTGAYRKLDLRISKASALLRISLHGSPHAGDFN